MSRISTLVGHAAVVLACGIALPSCGAPAPYIIASADSPDGKHVAEVWDQEAGGGALSYLIESVSVRRSSDRSAPGTPLVTREPSCDCPTLLRWRSPAELDVGVPLEDRGTKQLNVAPKGLTLRLVRYPDQTALYELVEKASESRKQDRAAAFLAAEEARRSPEFIDALARSAGFHVVAGPTVYAFDEPADTRSHFCKLTFSAPTADVARGVRGSLQAFIDGQWGQPFVSFRVTAGVTGLVEPSLRSLTNTSAQFISSSGATSLLSNMGRFHDEWQLNLSHPRELEMVLKALREPPYRLAFLFDLPDTMAVFEIKDAVPPEILSDFFKCVGDAKPVHFEGEPFEAFYRASH
jgi:hypothetical protein